MTRRIPHDPDAERSLISALLVRPAGVPLVLPVVAATDFYDPALAACYAAITALYAAGQPIDTVTVAARLNGHGPSVDLPRLIIEAAGVSNPAAYAAIIELHSRRRRVQAAALELDAALQDPAADMAAALTGHFDRLAALAVTRTVPSWAPRDLTNAIIGGQLDEPTVLARTDGRCLLYPGKVHAFNGESESLKSWLALVAAAQVLASGGTVVYVDFEDSDVSIVGRLLAMTVPDEAIFERFLYVRPDEPITAAVAQVDDLLTVRTPTLAVIDGITEAMALHGLDLKDNLDYARFHAAVPKRFAAHGAAVVMIDHVTKNTEQRGRFALGAQHKLAAIDGAAYTIDALTPFGHGRTGKARVTVAKDRPGGVREHATGGKIAADLTLTSYPDGGVTAHLEPVEPADPDGFEPTVIMERISRRIEREPGLSLNAIKASVKGDDKTKSLAVELLANRGFVAVDNGPNRSRVHRSIRPYRKNMKGETRDHDTSE